jgi:peroxisomal multifunctional enzyme type 2
MINKLGAGVNIFTHFFDYVIHNCIIFIRFAVLDLSSDHQGVYLGEQEDIVPNCVLELSDEDMAAIGSGELDAFNCYLNGQIKVKGDPNLTQRLNKLFEFNDYNLARRSDVIGFTEAYAQQPYYAMPSYSSSSYDFALAADQLGGEGGNGNGEPKCNIDEVFESWGSILETAEPELQKEIVARIKTVYHWNITKNGSVASVWTCDFKNGNGAIYRGHPKSGKGDCILTIDDDLLVRIFKGQDDAMKVRFD